ncbi:hypothetical protein SE00_07740 [Staphylococcus saprophyticus]|uniref:DUF1351 domain-containing protein n=1 Tax=Staphylococcus saprophyticus TaxID=29385 RepID=UPI0005975C01|nr:DUF1351 domain-containing protein [Staphylococcus saprophyticus]KIJ86840.1 hypothetical protein SE00_07740 [Staphylococcus saprophyticus]
MNDLIKEHDYKVTTTQGEVNFEEYNNLLSEANNLAEHVKQVEVNEENVKEAKKLMASMNNRVKDLENVRKDVKKSMLEPYNQFESQVKTIKQVIDEAVAHVKKQERELTEQEREEKREAIAQLFDKRIQHYDFGKILGFADFIKPQHLNKSTSINKVEDELVEWLEKTKRDLETINKLENKEDIIIEYQNTQDLSMAFEIVDKRNERKRKIEEQQKQTEQPTKTTYHVFTIGDDKEAQIAKLLLEQNNINFEYKNY